MAEVEAFWETRDKATAGMADLTGQGWAKPPCKQTQISKQAQAAARMTGSSGGGGEQVKN